MIGIYLNLLNQFEVRILCEIIDLIIMIGVLSRIPVKTGFMKASLITYKTWVV